MEVLLGILVVGSVLLAIAYPVWKPTPEPAATIASGPASRLSMLEERKESTYAAIRELGFDYQTDKLSEADYQIEIERLKAEAVSIARKIDELSSVVPTGPSAVEREVAAARDRFAQAAPTAQPAGPSVSRAATDGSAGEVGPFCTQCGRQAAAGDRFCAGCGTPLREVR